MKKRFADRWPFILAPTLFVILDAGLTLLGQPHVYWIDHTVTNEMAPMFNTALKASPWAFVAVIFLWTCGIAVLVFALPRILALVVSVTFITGHAEAALGWLFYRFDFSYWTHYWYHPITAVIIVAVCAYAFRNGLRKKVNPKSQQDSC